MKRMINIIRASVLLRDGTDMVSLEVDKPSPFPPGVSTQRLRMSFECQSNTGIQYCLDNFRVQPEVIDTRGRVR